MCKDCDQHRRRESDERAFERAIGLLAIGKWRLENPTSSNTRYSPREEMAMYELARGEITSREFGKKLGEIYEKRRREDEALARVAGRLTFQRWRMERGL